MSEADTAAIVRTDVIPAILGAAVVQIVTMADGSVTLEQSGQAITLHKYQAAEIAGFLWPADIKPLFKN